MTRHIKISRKLSKRFKARVYKVINRFKMNFKLFTICIVVQLLCVFYITDVKAELRSRQNSNSLSHYIVDMLRTFDKLKQPFTGKSANVHTPRRGGPFYKRHNNNF